MSENMINTFTNNEFGDMRTALVNDKIMFCATDIAKSLGYSNPRKAILDHCRYVTKRDAPHPQSKNKTITMSFIPEGDVYRLIARSKLESAERFEKWVFDEVLPTIRKTGGYVSNDDLFINTYLPFADEPTKLLFRTTLTTINQLNAKIERDKPLVEFADRVGDTSGLIDVGAFAKLLHKKNVKIGRTRLFAWLREQKYLRQNNEPYQKWINSGIFQTREYVYLAKGEPCIGIKTYITGKGQTYLTEKIGKAY